MSIRYSKHGQRRANQRGFRVIDVEMIRRYGILVPDRQAEVYLLRNKDVEREISARKKEIQRLEHMRGCEVVLTSNDCRNGGRGRTRPRSGGLYSDRLFLSG